MPSLKPNSGWKSDNRSAPSSLEKTTLATRSGPHNLACCWRRILLLRVIQFSGISWESRNWGFPCFCSPNHLCHLWLSKWNLSLAEWPSAKADVQAAQVVPLPPPRCHGKWGVIARVFQCPGLENGFIDWCIDHVLKKMPPKRIESKRIWKGTFCVGKLNSVGSYVYVQEWIRNSLPSWNVASLQAAAQQNPQISTRIHRTSLVIWYTVYPYPTMPVNLTMKNMTLWPKRHEFVHNCIREIYNIYDTDLPQKYSNLCKWFVSLLEK